MKRRRELIEAMGVLCYALLANSALGVVILFTVKADPEMAQFVAVQSLLSLVAGIMCARLNVEIDDE